MKVRSDKTMKLLAYADLQATDGDELCFTRPGVALQHYRTEKFFEDAARIYTEHHCNGIVDLGDTTDDRSSIPIPTVEYLGTGMSKLPNGQRWKLTGNHEQYLRDTTVNNRRLFDHWFHVIDGRMTATVEDTCLFFVSYPADYNDLTQWLIREARHVRGPKILFGHFEVQGAFYQNAKALGGVPLEALAPFNLVLLGHIHLPQSLTKRIHYVGSPFQQDWGETEQSKRVAIVNTKTMNVEWVPMEGYPEYRKVTLAEFEKLAVEQGEHRYRVVLNSHDETERFFRHPHFGRAVTHYNYDETPPEQTEKNPDWSFDGTCRRYLKTVPPKKVGIEISDEELLEITQTILHG
jgi:hypothetical protein